MRSVSAAGARASYVGYNTIGAQKVNLGAGNYFMKQIVLAGPGILWAVAGYVDAVSSLLCMGAVNADNAGDLGQLMGGIQEAQIGTSNAQARWYECPVGVFLPAGTYWLQFGILSGAANPNLYFDGGGTDHSFQSLGGGPVEGAGTNVTANRYSIRGTFLPS